MPRIPREYIETNFFHIMTQGINKKYIFDNPVDIKYYIDIMYKLAEEHNIKLIAYCVMSNHTHVLLEVKDIKDLSKYMQRINMRYGRYYNKKYNRVGYVFRDRYKAEGIYSEKHLYSCIKYIYDNPVKAGICDYAKDYPYSNYKENPSAEENNTFIDIEEDQEKRCKNVIEEVLLKNEIELTDIKKDVKKLKEIIVLLRDNYGILLRKIAEETGINREKVRQIYNKKR